MKKKLILFFLFLLPTLLSAEPVLQFSVSKSDNLGNLAVQNSLSVMCLSSVEVRAGVGFSEYFKAYAFGSLDSQIEFICRNRFSKIGNVHGFSFGIGFGYEKSIFGVDVITGIRAFSENSNSKNYYATVLLGLNPYITIGSHDDFDIVLGMPVAFAFSSLVRQQSIGLQASVRYSFEWRRK